MGIALLWTFGLMGWVGATINLVHVILPPLLIAVSMSHAIHLLGELREYAREVKRAHSVDFATRIGLNSGEVVVGKIGDDLRMDYTAQGETVGLAQRVDEQLAPLRRGEVGPVRNLPVAALLGAAGVDGRQ